MRKIVLSLALALMFVPALVAQDLNHGEVGVFADYTRLAPVDVNMVGLGARLSINVHKYVAMEGEMGYDFARTFTTGSGISGTRTSLHLLDGRFGPKLQIGTGAVRAFVTAKGGFLTFSGGNQSFPNVVNSVPTGNTNGVFYPGGGLEAYVGPVGLRLDVGDEMYFNNGAHHNLKVTFGPHIRF